MRIQLVAALALGLLACGRSQTVILTGRGAQGENGTAQISEGDNLVTVELSVPPSQAGVTQPAEIHNGRCGVNGSLFAALTDVVSGKSTTTVHRKYADLQGSTYIDVYASLADRTTVVSCGNVQ